MAITFLLVAGSLLTLLALAILQPLLPKQTNYKGHRIPTSAGIFLILIILLTLALAFGDVFVVDDGLVAYLIYALVAIVVGWADDVWGGSRARGFRGHLGALARGNVTTGALKILVLGGGAVLVGVSVFGFSLQALVAAFLLAGSVNAANLFDLRPGRAIKFLGIPILILLFFASYAGLLAVAGIVGGVAALFYFDLKGRIMLGDAGAAVYGSVLGYLVLVGEPGIIWWPAGLSIIGVTVLAEVSSISWVIREVEILRRFDRLGRGADG